MIGVSIKAGSRPTIDDPINLPIPKSPAATMLQGGNRTVVILRQSGGAAVRHQAAALF
jgi:hypothetical protein